MPGPWSGSWSGLVSKSSTPKSVSMLVSVLSILADDSGMLLGVAFVLAYADRGFSVRIAKASMIERIRLLLRLKCLNGIFIAFSSFLKFCPNVWTFCRESVVHPYGMY